jgi:hypothetical protein
MRLQPGAVRGPDVSTHPHRTADCPPVRGRGRSGACTAVPCASPPVAVHPPHLLRPSPFALRPSPFASFLLVTAPHSPSLLSNMTRSLPPGTHSPLPL